jgi:choline-sulfatase
VRRGGAVLLAAVLVAAGLAWWRRAPAAAPVPPSRPSVLLLTIDTLRADRVGVGLTPHIDGLAARGVTFAEGLSSVPLTLPAHATILSGLEPPRHGVRDNGTYVFPPDVPTLATVLKERGYATGAFVGAYVLDRRFGLARGFDVYDDAVARREQGASVLESERSGAEVAAAADRWLKEGSGPFLAWVHLYDPHAPYAAPAPFSTGRAPYDAEVAYADEVVGRVLASARGRAGEDLVVVLLADHGESLGEHGEATHGLFVYQSTLRIPFVVAAPGLAPGPRPGLARTVDVMPTVLGLLGAAGRPGLDGRDVLSGPPGAESYAETLHPESLGWAPLYALRVAGLKVIDAPRPELYDLRADPAEQSDLAAARPTEVARLTEALASARAGERRTAAAADPEVAERLRALGYVGSAPAADGGPRPDPKDRIRLWQRFERAAGLASRGDGTSIPELRAVVAEEPSNATFRRVLASTLRKAGQPSEAAAVLRDLETVAPHDPLAWHEQAQALAAGGRLDAALAAEQRALALDPRLVEAHNHLGILYASRGRLPEALASFEKATAVDAHDARAWNNQANVLRELGRSEEARRAYETAARLDPRDPDPRNGLGVLAVERNELDAAAIHFVEVLDLRPGHHEARLNLAVVRARQQRPREAAAELERLLQGGPDPGMAQRARALLQQLR